MISKFEKHYNVQGAQIWLPNIEGFLCLWAGYWRVQKGKGTLRPKTLLNFLVVVYEKTRELVTLTLRIEDAFPNEIDVTSDLNELVFYYERHFKGF